MVSEKFAEAFDRFCRDVNVDKIETFKQLESAFASWARHKWVPTDKQINALKDEAEKPGIPLVGYRTIVKPHKTALERAVEAVQAEEARKMVAPPAPRKPFSRKYVSFPVWLEKTARTTRTTRYQQRVIRYMQKHPDANLSEARGHTKNVNRS